MIDTIFYYVGTKEEYLQKVSNGEIASRTIVFVEDTGEIFKNGIMFSNYRLLVESLDRLELELLLLIENSRLSLLNLIGNLRDYVNQTFDEELLTISGQLESYELLLEKLRLDFLNFEGELGTASRDIDSLKGIIRDYASWKSSTTQTLTTIQRLIDAQNGVISDQGTYINTLRNSVINYESKVDLIEGKFQLYMEQYDISNKVREIIGREITLSDGKLHDFATYTDVDNMFRNSIDVWFDALTPSWLQLTSKAQRGDDAYTALAGFNSRIEDLDGQLTALTSQFSSWNDDYSSFLAGLQTGANSTGSFFHLIASGEKSLLEITAEIFATVNNEGSEIMIKADRVLGLGQWILEHVITTTLEAGVTPNRIFINSIDGIKLERNTFKFNVDGSGQIAGNRISWDALGNISINGEIIGVDNISGLGNYWNQLVGVIIGNWGSGTFKNWVEGQLSGKASLSDLTSLLGTINTTYLTKAEYNQEKLLFLVSENLTSVLENSYGQRLGLAESSIALLTGYFTNNGGVIGLSSEVDISAKVQDYINNDSAISSLKTWARTVSGSSSAGFDLSAEIRNIAGEVVRSASITATLTDDLLSRLQIRADLIELNGTSLTIGDFIRADGNHFQVWNFDVVEPNYYALRAYLKNQNNPGSVYADISGGGHTKKLNNLFQEDSTSNKYKITSHVVNKAKAAIMMDWSGIVFLKDYTDPNNRTDTYDHTLSSTIIKNEYRSSSDDVPLYYHDSNTNTDIPLVRSVPSTPIGSTSVSIGAASGNGLLAWGKIRWADKYSYVETSNGSNVWIPEAIQNRKGDYAYWEPIILDLNNKKPGLAGYDVAQEEANGVLIIENAYLVNPKIVNATTVNAGDVPRVDYI